MSDDGGSGRDESEAEETPSAARSRGFRLGVGIRPLSDLLGPLIEVGVSESPPPDTNAIDWTTVDEDEENQRQSGATSSDERTERTRWSETDEYLFDTRFDGDEFVVTADIPGASKDDLSVGIGQETNQLVIEKDGAVLERISLPWESVEPTRVWFNNGVLEVRMRPTTDDSE